MSLPAWLESQLAYRGIEPKTASDEPTAAPLPPAIDHTEKEDGDFTVPARATDTRKP